MRESGVTATLRPHAGNGRDGVRSCLRVFTKPRRVRSSGLPVPSSGLRALCSVLVPNLGSQVEEARLQEETRWKT